MLEEPVVERGPHPLSRLIVSLPFLFSVSPVEVLPGNLLIHSTAQNQTSHQGLGLALSGQLLLTAQKETITPALSPVVCEDLNGD